MPEVMVPLTIRDLTAEDLPACDWSGSRSHLVSVAEALERAMLGEVDYLAACPPSGLPVAIGGVDYGREPDAWDEEAPDGSTLAAETSTITRQIRTTSSHLR